MIESFGELLAHWTAQELAAGLGVNYQTAAQMRRRESVAPFHWPRLMEMAAAKSLSIDEKMLVRFACLRKGREPAPEEAA